MKKLLLLKLVIMVSIILLFHVFLHFVLTLVDNTCDHTELLNRVCKRK